eukprot:10296319-Alexandrium_andersonii.AAC.1
MKTTVPVRGKSRSHCVRTPFAAQALLRRVELKPLFRPQLRATVRAPLADSSREHARAACE